MAKTVATTEQLVVAVPSGSGLVPAGKLVLTRAPQALDVPAYMQRVANLPAITVETHADAKALLDEIRERRRACERFHDMQKAPLTAVRNMALQLEKDDVGAFKTLETQVGAKLLAFDAEIERQRKAEQERLNREAVAKAQAEADARAKALREAAKAEDDAATKRALNAQARALKDAPVFVAPVQVAPVVAKTSTTTRWAAEITDVDALVVAVAVGILRRRVPPSTALLAALADEREAPLAALEPERLREAHPWLNTAAVQGQEEFTLPGVVAVKKTALSGR